MKLEANLIKLLLCYHVIFVLNDFVLGSISIFDEKNSTLINIDDLTAAFGPRLPESGFIGFIKTAEPLHGCTAISRPPNVSFVEPKQWIALIMRTPTKYGNCSFDLKVYNAQNAGYSAVIIYNSESDSLIRMSSSSAFKIVIPSVFIGKSSGILIDSAYTYKNRTLVIITNDDADLSYLLIPFICVVSVCFIIAISIFVVKFAIHFYKIRKNRFPKSALKKIPTKKYQKTDKYDTCPICLNEYEEGVKIRILPCEHAYHIECIDKWLLRNNRFCPVCKRRVLPGGSDSESSDESTGNATASNTSSAIIRRNSLSENHPNEEDDTNESSRLLVNVRSNSNDDNISSVTLNTNLAKPNDASSLNNQMTTSVSSSQMLNQTNSNKDCLRSSSSRYGSITSVNNVSSAAVATTSTKQVGGGGSGSGGGEENSDFICEIKKLKDSKSTPDDEDDDVYFTPVTDGTASVNFKVVSDTKEKKLKNKHVKKSNSSNQIAKHEQTSLRIENESIASTSSASFTTNQESDTAALLFSKNKKTNVNTSNVSKSTSRSLSPSSRNNNKSASDSARAQDKNNTHNNDDDSKIV